MSLTETREADSAAGIKPGLMERAVLSLSVIGSVGAQMAGRPVEVRGQKARALLAYMALSGGVSETRERLVGLLWSESDDARARGSLRQALRELRQAFDAVEFSGMRMGKVELAIDPVQISVDIWTAIAEAEAQRVHPLLLDTPRVTERLLDGYEDLDPAFRIWLLARRQTLHDRLLRALESGLGSADADPAERLRMAEALANLDPTHEEACRHIMRVKAEAGDIAAALRVYKQLWDLLDEEYGMEPSAKTQRLVAEIKGGVPSSLPPEPVPATAAPAPAARETAVANLAAAPATPAARLMLVVEPFAVDGVTPGRLHIVDGFRHHLIACLVKFREWQVTERNPAPAEGVMPMSTRYKVQAHVHQGGEALNVILSLKEVETENHIWSDQLRLDAGNMFEVQQRIVQRITVALNIQLSAERLARLASQPALPRELYDRWLLVQDLVARRQPEGWQQATEIFHSLVRDAPNFGPAYSSLVQLRNTMQIVHPGLFRTPAFRRETLALAKTAAQIDPIDSRAQLCLAWAYAFDFQFEPALLHFGLACDLNDTDPWTLVSSAHGHAFAGQFERAKQMSERALHVALLPSPIHWAYRAVMHFMWADYEGCIEAADRSRDAAAVTPMWRTAALAQLGRVDAARQEAERFLAFVRSHWHEGGTPTDQQVGNWIMHLFPIRQRADWERLRDALALAGLPVADAAHEAA